MQLLEWVTRSRWVQAFFLYECACVCGCVCVCACVCVHVCVHVCVRVCVVWKRNDVLKLLTRNHTRK